MSMMRRVADLSSKLLFSKFLYVTIALFSMVICVEPSLASYGLWKCGWCKWMFNGEWRDIEDCKTSIGPLGDFGNAVHNGPAGHSGLGPGGGTGRIGTDPEEGLVDPGSGSVLESNPLFGLASKGGPLVQWVHALTFDHRSTGPGDTAQGYGWYHPYLTSLSVSGGTVADADVTWRADAHHKYTFTNAGSYSFSTNDSTFATIVHEHARDPADTYRLSFLDGTILVFNDYDYTNTNERGKLRYIEDLYGNRLTVTYQGSNTGRIDYISDPSGHYFRYSYDTSTGANDGKLLQIKVWKDSSTNDNTELIAQIDFTYMETGHATYNAGCGITADLIKVVVSTHKTDETGTSFSITQRQGVRGLQRNLDPAFQHAGHGHGRYADLHDLPRAGR